MPASIIAQNQICAEIIVGNILEDLIKEMKGEKDVIVVETSFPEDNPFGREYESLSCVKYISQYGRHHEWRGKQAQHQS